MTVSIHLFTCLASGCAEWRTGGRQRKSEDGELGRISEAAAIPSGIQQLARNDLDIVVQARPRPRRKAVSFSQNSLTPALPQGEEAAQIPSPSGRGCP